VPKGLGAQGISQLQLCEQIRGLLPYDAAEHLGGSIECPWVVLEPLAEQALGQEHAPFQGGPILHQFFATGADSTIALLRIKRTPKRVRGLDTLSW
jgi:hypothetical protein